MIVACPYVVLDNILNSSSHISAVGEMPELDACLELVHLAVGKICISPFWMLPRSLGRETFGCFSEF